MPAEASADALPALASGSDLLPATIAELPGTRKAAVLMAALGSERAANVLQRLGEEEIESLSMEMAGLSAVDPDTTDSIFSELAALASRDAGASGGIEFARDVIERALGPERAAELLGRMSARTETPPFEFLQRVPAERTVALLRSESPQTIALILASLQTSSAAQVLARLPERQQPDIALRIARMGETSAQVVQQVEDVIRHKLTAVVERSTRRPVAPRRWRRSSITRTARPSARAREARRRPTRTSPRRCAACCSCSRTSSSSNERAMQQVLREADQKDLVLALRGAPDNVKEVVLTNMSERGAEMIKEEMEIQPPQRKRDVDDAQSRIVAVVRQLEEAGAIVIASDSEDESEAVV